LSANTNSNSKPSDPVRYYGLEIEYFPIFDGQSKAMDIKVAAFKPYKLCAQPVIIAPDSDIVPDAEGGGWDEQMMRIAKKSDYARRLIDTKDPALHVIDELYFNRQSLNIPLKCLQIWGISSIILPDQESYSKKLHGLAWMLAFAQLAASRWNQGVSAYAVTKYGRSPEIYHETPHICFGPNPS
jgi:hypothetical protein